MPKKHHIIASGLALALAAGPALPGLKAQQPTDLSVSAEIGAPGDGLVPLFLAVTLNGTDTGLVAEFEADLDGGNMRSTRAELEEIGILAPKRLGRSIALSAIEGLTYSYDPIEQALQIEAPHSALLPDVISASRAPAFEAADKAWGGVLNYSLVAEHGFGGRYASLGPAFSASLDGWLFAPGARLRSTGFLSRDLGPSGARKSLRFETALTVDMPGKALRFTMGDFTTSGPAWFRPVRLGGIELRRDFSLRSDLVTDQRLSYAGAAAVPSTVDVFIENNRVFSTPVAGGPFRLEDIAVSGGGDAEIVVQGVDGQVSRRTVSFFASSALMKKGMADYSIGYGLARQGFGLTSNDYGQQGVFSASFRYGLTERLTLGSHFSATDGLSLAGAGLTTTPFARSELSLSLAASRHRGQTGRFAQLDFHTEFAGLDFNVSSSRSERGYADLAYVTGLDYLASGGTAGSLLEVPLQQDVVSLAIPVSRENRRLGLSLVSARRATSRDRLASVSYGTSLGGGRGALSLNGAYDLETGNTRVTLGLSMKLAKRTYGRSSVYTDTNGRQTQDISVTRTKGEGIGAWGYHVQAAHRAGGLALRARGDVRTRYGEIAGEVQAEQGGTYLRTQLDGAAVFAGGKAAFGNEVRDGFALADLGVADIPVYLDNRPVGLTNARGRVLVSGLNSYRSNRISVNVRDLPESATLGVTAVNLVPSRGSGQYVNFSGSEEAGVIVILRDASGRFLPPGTVVSVNGGGEAYVGYDGETWIESPRRTNTLRADLGGHTCEARFGFSGGDGQERLGPVECR